jgi:hypothetical protein
MILLSYENQKGGVVHASNTGSYRARAAQGAEDRCHRGRRIDEQSDQRSRRAVAQRPEKEGEEMTAEAKL